MKSSSNGKPNLNHSPPKGFEFRLIFGLFFLFFLVFSPATKSFSKPDIAFKKAPAQVQNHFHGLTIPEGAKTHEMSKTPGIKVGILKEGETIASVLASWGVPPDEIVKITKAASRFLDLRSIRAGTTYRLAINHSGSIQWFDCLPDANKRVVVFRKNGEFVGRRDIIPFERKLFVLKGTIKASLVEDMVGMGEEISLAVRYVEALAWSVNFFRDPRKGDSFGLVFEKRFVNGKFAEYGPILAVSYDGKLVKQSGYLYSAKGVRPGFYDEKGRPLRKAFRKAPLRYTRISSRFTMRRLHPILGIYRPHQGVDYVAPRGTPVYAVADGVVEFKGRQGGFGNLVILRHMNGYKTYYGHLLKFAKPRGRVSQGDLIGYVGATGLATGPHLDFRISLNSRFINPLKLKPPEGPALAKNEVYALTKVVSVLNPHLLGQMLGCREVSVPGWVASAGLKKGPS